MQEEIYEKLNNIVDLKERKILKELLNNLLVELDHHNKNMYQNLENRIFNEVEYTKQNYSIYTTIATKELYDPVHYFLHPMKNEDVNEKIFDMKEIEEAIQEKKIVNMSKVFVECDYLLFNEMIKEDITFKGVIKTNIRNYDGNFKIKKDNSYLDLVADLYKVFLKNNIPWKTINIPYISRMADIVLIDFQGEVSEDEILKEIVVDFREYSKFMKYNMIPLWNIKTLSLKSTGFPMPCADDLHFEHIISVKEEGAKNGFLVQYEDNNIKEIKQVIDSIIITSKEGEAKIWNLLEIIAPKISRIENFHYRIMSNSQKVSFIEKIAGNAVIKTKGELTRLIDSFELSEYLEFKDIKLEDREDAKELETYDMNYFIIDEIRDIDYKKKLVLYFTTNKSDYFIIRDLLSFIVSEVQMYYPEYQCEGKIL